MIARRTRTRRAARRRCNRNNDYLHARRARPSSRVSPRAFHAPRRRLSRIRRHRARKPRGDGGDDIVERRLYPRYGREYVVLVRYVPRRVDRGGVQLDQSFPESEVCVLRVDAGGFVELDERPREEERRLLDVVEGREEEFVVELAELEG